jgi:AraC-like DNA-binding protein
MCAFRSLLRKNGAAPAQSNGVTAKGRSAGEAESTNGAVNVGALIPATIEERLRKVLHVIKTGPHRHIQELALECNLSQSYLQHLFKQHTGFRLGHLLNQQRLERAAELLLLGNMSVKEVASAVGYEHTSSFSRAFVRYFQTAPSQYRKRTSEREMLRKNLCG